MDPVSQSLLERVRAAHGAIRVSTLNPTRTQRRRLHDLVEHHALRQHPHGVVSLPGTPSWTVAARTHGGLVCCEQGARLHGLDTPSWVRQTGTHLLVPHHGTLLTPGPDRLHRSRSLTVPSPTGPLTSDLPRTLAQFLLCASDPLSPLTALDHALRTGRTTTGEVDQVLRHAPGSRQARQWLSLASPRARSPLETCVRLDLIEAGIPFRDGVQVPGVGEVDFLVAELLVLEADGETFHDDSEQFALDRWRDRQLARRGLRTLRFTREDVRLHRVVPDVLAVLARIAA